MDENEVENVVDSASKFAKILNENERISSFYLTSCILVCFI